MYQKKKQVRRKCLSPGNTTPAACQVPRDSSAIVHVTRALEIGAVLGWSKRASWRRQEFNWEPQREEGFEKMEKRREAHNIMNKAEIHKGWRARRTPSWPEQGFLARESIPCPVIWA